MPDLSHVTVSIQGNDGVPVSTAIGVARIRMRSSIVFLQFACGHCGRRTQVLRLHAGSVIRGRCTGFRY